MAVFAATGAAIVVAEMTFAEGEVERERDRDRERDLDFCLSIRWRSRSRARGTNTFTAARLITRRPCLQMTCDYRRFEQPVHR